MALKFGNKKKLTVINEGQELEKVFCEIYSPKPELKEENTLPFEVLILDQDIKIWDKKFMFSLCDESFFFGLKYVVRIEILLSIDFDVEKDPSELDCWIHKTSIMLLSFHRTWVMTFLLIKIINIKIIKNIVTVK